MLEIEKELHIKGFKSVACIDEVGRGCLAGDVTACAVIMPYDLLIEGVKDSKKLSKKKRELLFDLITSSAVYIGIGTASNKEIDRINIKRATHLAMERAVKNLKNSEGEKGTPDFLLIDAEKIPLDIPQMGIIKGDSKCHGIAAASIIAKVTRDRLMTELHKIYPMYGLDRNAGYGTKEHVKALNEYGVCEIHRNTFLSRILDKNKQIEMF
jgi:ribonuclease HII